MGEITNNIGLTMESDVFSPVSVVFFRKSMQLKGYNTKNEYMGLQQSKIRYPLVNVYKKLWKDPPCLMGKSRISTGPFSIASTRGTCPMKIEDMGPMRPWGPKIGGFHLPSGLKNWDAVEATDGMGCTILHYFPENPMWFWWRKCGFSMI